MINTRAFLKNMMGFSVVPIVSALVTLLVIPVISNVFPAEEYGKINLFYTTGLTLTTCFSLGLDSSLIRYYFEPPSGLDKRTIKFIALVVGLAIDIIFTFLVLIFFSDYFSILLFGEDDQLVLLALLGVFVCSLIVFRLLNVDARLQGDSRKYNVQCILQIIATKIAFVAVALYSTRYSYSIVAMVIMMLVLSSVFFFLQRKSFSFASATISRQNLLPLFSFGVPTMAASFILSLNGMVGKYILGYVGQFESVGILAIAITVANAFSVVPTAFTTYWSPFMYENYKTEQAFICRVHDYVMFGAGVILVFFILLQNVLFLFIGGEYASCQAYFMLIMLTPIQVLISETTAYGITLKKKTYINAIIATLGVIINVIVSFLLIRQIGIFAVALGCGISAIFICLCDTIIGQHFYRTINKPIRTILAGFFIVTMCIINTYISGNITHELFCSAVFLVAFLVLYQKQVRFLIEQISHRNAR